MSPNFVRKFGYTNRESAYSVLIENSQIDTRWLKRLRDAFKKFKDNAETMFWSAMARLDTTLTSRKAGMIARAIGIQQAALDYDGHFRDLDHRADLQFPAELIHGSLVLQNAVVYD